MPPPCRYATTNSTPLATPLIGRKQETCSPCPCTRRPPVPRSWRCCKPSVCSRGAYWRVWNIRSPCKLRAATGGLMIRSSAAIAALVVMVAGVPTSSAATGGESDSKIDPVRALVGRLDLDKYKSTIKGLTRFGDRRQGTDRNRAAVDWIEAQLKSYGCANISRIKYTYSPTETRRPSGPPVAPDAAQGGGRYRGLRGQTGVNTDPLLQLDEKLRALNTQPTAPGEREEVYCTKLGSTHPEEMYIVGAHMDGHGWGEAANDDGSGTAIVMELARILMAPDVKTERSIRFVL